MSVSAARAAAFDILLRVGQEDAYASELLHSPRCAKLSATDHGLATELVMGVLRWRSVLDKPIAEQSSHKLATLDPEVLTALRLAVYQLLFLDRVPGRAAVHESVELVKRARKRSAVPFANAVLRKLADGKDTHYDAASISAARTVKELSGSSAHPLWLVERWAKEFGLNAAQQTCMRDQQVPEVTLRLHDAGVENELRREGVELAAGQLLASARRVRCGDLTKTAAFREGRVTIQDEASQLVALLVGRGSSILDCCAAPGGKTRLLAERNPGATIVAAEIYPRRAVLLRKLVPLENVWVIAADVCQLPLCARFDRVLADVPCSGTGTLARNPEIKWRLRPEGIVELQAQQVEILRAAMQQVAPGGRLVYSTCSLEREENSEVMERALAADQTFRVLDCRAELERLNAEGELLQKDIDSLVRGPYLTTLPGRQPCDGFFAAILENNHRGH
jgi:16S rRNA (cytosine967-C5)-methyltransferase